MSKRGKTREHEESISDGDEPKNKSRKPSDDSEDSDTIFICELSKNRKVYVKMWMGKVMVDIREFYEKDGKELPGRKGISLSLDQWKILRDHASEIDKEIAEKN